MLNEDPAMLEAEAEVEAKSKTPRPPCHGRVRI